jgi:hypothetical protein
MVSPTQANPLATTPTQAVGNCCKSEKESQDVHKKSSVWFSHKLLSAGVIRHSYQAIVRITKPSIAVMTECALPDMQWLPHE